MYVRVCVCVRVRVPVRFSLLSLHYFFYFDQRSSKCLILYVLLLSGKNNILLLMHLAKDCNFKVMSEENASAACLARVCHFLYCSAFHNNDLFTEISITNRDRIRMKVCAYLISVSN